MPSHDENYKLLWSVILQKSEDGKMDGVDWKKTAQDVGIESSGAASKRWARLRAQFVKGDFSGGASKVGASEGAEKPPKAKKPAAPKIKKDAPATKKRKVAKIEEEEEVAEEDQVHEHEDEGFEETEA